MLGWLWEIKIKRLKSGYYTFKKCYIEGAPRKKQHHCFFRGTPKISRKIDFYTYKLGEWWQIKIKKTRIRILYVLKMLYTGRAPYKRRKWCHRFLTFLQGTWADVDKLKWIFKISKINKINQETRFMILSTLKLLCPRFFLGAPKMLRINEQYT